MQASQIPSKFQKAFASGAASGNIRAIPVTTTDPDAASETLGWPPSTLTPEGAGGVAPDGRDMNGLDNQLSAWALWFSIGGPVTYDATQQTAIGGYPKGAIVASATTFGAFWLCTADNNMTNPDAGGSGWAQFPPLTVHGQCRFLYQGATQCALFPSGGNLITINGQSVTIPSGGVNLTNTGLAVNTLYYVYAYVSGGALTLTASATGHTTASNGVEVMSGDDAYTLVGMVYTNGSAQFSPQGYGVLSWFNRRSLWLSNANTSGLQTTSTSLTSIGAPPLTLLTWADEGVGADINGAVTNTNAGNSSSTGVAIDGNPLGTGSTFEPSTNSFSGPSSAKWGGYLSEGAHTAQIFGKVSAGTGEWGGAQMFINVVG